MQLIYTSLPPHISIRSKMGLTWEEHGTYMGGTWDLLGRNIKWLRLLFSIFIMIQSLFDVI